MADNRVPDFSEAEWAEAPVLGTPTPERLQAELATLPATAPKRKPSGGPTLTHQEASALLGVSRSTLRYLIKTGKLRHLGKDRQDRNMVDREEAEALAADRASNKFEREHSGAALEEHKLEHDLGLSSDPRSWDRAARERGLGADQRRMHDELLDGQQRQAREMEFGMTRLLNEMRTQTEHLAAIRESLANLNTGALLAAGAVAGAAVLEDDVKNDFRKKLRGLVGQRSQEEPLPVPAANAEVPPLRTISGEVVHRQRLEGTDLEEIRQGFDQICDRLRVESTK